MSDFSELNDNQARMLTDTRQLHEAYLRPIRLLLPHIRCGCPELSSPDAPAGKEAVIDLRGHHLGVGRA